VGWAYREGAKPAHAYLHQMGLWDLEPGAGGLERVPTLLVSAYRELVASGAAAAGRSRAARRWSPRQSPIRELPNT